MDVTVTSFHVEAQTHSPSNSRQSCRYVAMHSTASSTVVDGKKSSDNSTSKKFKKIMLYETTTTLWIVWHWHIEAICGIPGWQCP